MRALLAEGKAKPEQIGIVAASPADFDEHVLALSQDANIPLHFVHGIKAVATPDGQTAAALADILVKGISQGRVRRLFRRLAWNTCSRWLTGRMDTNSSAGRAARDSRTLGTGLRRY